MASTLNEPRTVVRFAPSPTGNIHIGNVRTAILNWLFARKSGGTFILRYDDTDTERAREEFATGIGEDLAWLGLDFDQVFRQSERSSLYSAAAERLKASGRLYPCFETADELDRRRRMQRARGLPPIYDRSALRLSKVVRDGFIAEGRLPHWRFRLDNTDGDNTADPAPTLVYWADLVRGEQTVDVGSLSDPVMIREDGSFLYTFTSVVDDADMGVSHIIRGEDHVTNTGVQIQLFEALGAEPPRFAHHSLLVGADGAALSKRMGDLAVRAFREQGLEPQTVASLAALIGTSDAVEPHRDIGELVQAFDFEKISRSPARFDPSDLELLNAKLLHGMDHDDVAGRLVALGVGGGAEFWDAVKGNLRYLADAADWWSIVSAPIEPVITDSEVCAAAAAALPDGPLDATIWKPWTDAVKSASGRKGRALFMPLRQALTGRDNGPELAPLLAFMGRDRIIARLGGATA